MYGLISPRAVALFAAVISTIVLVTATSGSSFAYGEPIHVCDPTHETCTVGVVVGGGTGGSGGTGSQAASGCQNTDPTGGCNPCPADVGFGARPPAVTQVCADYLQNSYCRAIQGDALAALEVVNFNSLSANEIAALNAQFASEGCPAIVTPASLAQQAFATIVFPHPSGHRSPSETQSYKGYSFTYVNLWTYYWTDSAIWHPLIATASAAGLSATVTATPTSLSFDPGDGSVGQVCSGPGRPWTELDGDSPPSAGACGYQYLKVTGPGYDRPITSRQVIVWTITWTGTDDTGGALPALATSTSGQLNVMQIRTVNQ
ncbi:MAG: histone methyltransferase [Pseudonocardiales bacterium]|nr:histone methyltransferase [Pseudonocardiales bacterium]